MHDYISNLFAVLYLFLSFHCFGWQTQSVIYNGVMIDAYIPECGDDPTEVSLPNWKPIIYFLNDHSQQAFIQWSMQTQMPFIHEPAAALTRQHLFPSNGSSYPMLLTGYNPSVPLGTLLPLMNPSARTETTMPTQKTRICFKSYNYGDDPSNGGCAGCSYDHRAPTAEELSTTRKCENCGRIGHLQTECKNFSRH